ncbi:MAG TPA: hypothetical protein VG167_15860 [Verrucomicrobiae bacterium]|nr:hypothetical protein [Verrucomicrobiae bacterium]
MPNQRKAGLKLVGAYLAPRERAQLKAEAKRRGLTVADLVRELVKEYIRREAEGQAR